MVSTRRTNPKLSAVDEIGAATPETGRSGDGRASNAHLARLTETAVEAIFGEGLLEDHLESRHEVHGLAGGLLGGLLDLHGGFFPARTKATGAGRGANGQRMRHRSEVLGVSASHGDAGGDDRVPRDVDRAPSPRPPALSGGRGNAIGRFGDFSGGVGGWRHGWGTHSAIVS